MRFENIPALKDVKQLLTDAAHHNHIAHAQLFVGAEGALNLPIALAFATYLHCENPTEHDACGTCAACTKNAKFIHPDTHFIYPYSNVKNDKDEERLKADIAKTWRSFLLEHPYGNLNDWTNYYGGEDKQGIISTQTGREIIKTLSLKPFESKAKVMIIWQPELMHSAAANAILKILEEPPPQTYFILVSNAADKLLPTIISRTQIVTIPLLHNDEVAEYLVSNHQLDSTRAEKIAQLAEGKLNAALHLIDQPDDDNNQRFIEWMRACAGRQYLRLVTMADEYHALDKLSQRNMFMFSLNMMREALLCLAGGEVLSRTKGDDITFLKRFSDTLNINKIETITSLISESAYYLERNASAKMVFLDLSLKISQTFKS
jgi:DNA polymerase-3 subunit delta'